MAEADSATLSQRVFALTNRRENKTDVRCDGRATTAVLEKRYAEGMEQMYCNGLTFELSGWP